MRFTRSLPIVLAALLAGCAHRPFRIANLSEGELHGVEESELCGAYGVTGAEAIHSEIDRRNLIPSDQWSRVAAHEVSEGMSKCAVLAALGYPDDSAPSNGSTMLVYLNSMYVRVYLIEIRDGVAQRITR